MKILVVGGGGREHSLALKISQSPLVKKVYVAPGNGGIFPPMEAVSIKANNIESLVSFAGQKKIDLTVIGPEEPLTLGIADRFKEKGLKVFGPSSSASLIEGSKVFAREFMTRANIQQPDYEIFEKAEDALKFLDGSAKSYPLVVKADGLAAGKGVVVASSAGEASSAVHKMMVEKVFGKAGDNIIIEDCLQGKEVSFFVITDGEKLIPLQTAQDYKRIGDGDTGPNTGGMGCYSPSAYLTPEETGFIINKIMKPAIEGLALEGRTYKGFLYAGLMVTPGGIKVLEFNCRMGDPEAEVLIPRIESDLVPYLEAAASGDLKGLDDIMWKTEAAVTVVLASKGYPSSPETGFEITGLQDAENIKGVTVYHSGTALKDGRLVTSGGRVLAVTTIGKDVPAARAAAYNAVSKISFKGMYCRRDIAVDVK